VSAAPTTPMPAAVSVDDADARYAGLAVATAGSGRALPGIAADFGRARSDADAVAVPVPIPAPRSPACWAPVGCQGRPRPRTLAFPVPGCCGLTLICSEISCRNRKNIHFFVDMVSA
jgi:hypothetical protein